MPLARETLYTLHKSCPLLRSMCVCFPSDLDEDVLGYVMRDLGEEPGPQELQAREIYGQPDLTIFSGLEELVLEGLAESISWWRSQLVQVLMNSPGLRKLGLSLSTETLGRHDADQDREEFDDFFDLLCDEYGRTSTAPLHLESLDLGKAVYVYELRSLEKLTDLSYLREVRIDNSGVYNFVDVIMMYDGGEWSGLAFDAFGPAHCPNLRRFTASNHRADVQAFLATVENPAFTRQLAVSCENTDWGYESAMLLRTNPETPSRPLHLRMLDVDLQREQIYLCDGQGKAQPRDTIPSAEQVLDDLITGDEGTLEGLSVHLREDPEAKGYLEHLELLIVALTKLANITQLSINRHRWIGIDSAKTILEEVACMVAGRVRHLRYISVYGTCWKIWRLQDGVLRLEELEDREIRDVELFSRTVWEPAVYHHSA
jgi:hypothetical protein